MEDGPHNAGNGEQGSLKKPPPAPNPNADQPVSGIDPLFNERSDQPLRLESAEWDINSISATGALRMLQLALEKLTDATGDVPPTPPISRPTTPTNRHDSTTDSNSDASYGNLRIGSPEAHPQEPIREIGQNAEEHYIQHAAIARRFFSKVPPPFSITDYLSRQHTWCPHSPGVYLAAAHYIHRLCVSDLAVPATNRTVHRLAIAAIRVAAKALEDNKWPQERVAKVGGLGRVQLMNLEVTLCFLLDFELGVDERSLAKGMFGLQQAARQGAGVRGPLREGFRMAIPLRKKHMSMIAAAS